MHPFGKKIRAFTNDSIGDWYTLTTEAIFSVCRPIRPLLINSTQVFKLKIIHNTFSVQMEKKLIHCSLQPPNRACSSQCNTPGPSCSKGA